MPHGDSDSTARVTAAALERIEAARGRADAATPGPWYQGMVNTRRIPEVDVTHAYGFCAVRASAADDGDGGINDAAFIAHARADLPLLCDIAAAAVRLVAFAAERNGDWPWWGWTGEDGAGCMGCLADDDDLDDQIGFTDDWSAFPHEPECWAVQLDAAIRAAGEAGHNA